MRGIFLILAVILISSGLILNIPRQNTEKGNIINATNTTSEQNISAEQNITAELFLPQYECLNDSQCNDTEICVSHLCKNLTCDYPYYAQYHKCDRLECINNEECKSNQYCDVLYHVCMNQYCGFCQYPEEHECKRYECCSDKGCGGTMLCFARKCIQNPSLMDFQTILTGNRRTTYRAILDYSVLKNFDIGLLIAQNQQELDEINNNTIYLDNMTFDNFKDYILLIVLQHGKMPTDVRFIRIIQKWGTIYVGIDASEAEKGFTDDAWQVIKIRRDDFTEKNNLAFRITPTGKMIIGGEEILSGININYPADSRGNQILCVNITIYEGATTQVSLNNRNYEVTLHWIEEVSGIQSVYVSIDGSEKARIEEGGNKRIANLMVYANAIYYSAKEASWNSVELGLCLEDF